MKVEQFVENVVNSEQPEKSITFYRDIVGLTPNPAFRAGALMAGWYPHGRSRIGALPR